MSVPQTTLLEYMRRNFPTVHAKVVGAPKDTKVDYKSADYARKFPTRSGKYRSDS